MFIKIFINNFVKILFLYLFKKKLIFFFKIFLKKKYELVNTHTIGFELPNVYICSFLRTFFMWKKKNIAHRQEKCQGTGYCLFERNKTNKHLQKYRNIS